MICMPIGIPSCENPQGTDSAGRPASGESALYFITAVMISTFSPVGISTSACPIRGTVNGTVGVMIASVRARTFAKCSAMSVR